ncbi:hypothetical protein OJ996_14685 [Luteolibacter sp. GHJ8]|jgi:hypothetical protein|uniref:Uncharacterized protein n=1 Tax=Luteolibacter rhizosphaerae TaxID=2989719 RepID=A0ABT3G4Q9_9BACT|nr:hypothetical protein [Luteolibacter rhizosphaerae]MCW1914831.1 hypothetical protein [Luteolibacter rhizosphaerae]
MTLALIVKIFIVLFLIAWTWLGGFLVVKYGALFGPHHDHRAETPGARSFGIAHIAAVWVGGFVLAVYFLFL